MTEHPAWLIQKLWNYCNILRDDGLSYGDYVEQLTFLLFLKMADEQSRRSSNESVRGIGHVSGLCNSILQ
jgi:type I restriction enzyme M protein